MNRSATKQDPARNVRLDGFVAQMEAAERANLAHAIERQDMAELERAGIARRIKQARNEAGLSQPEMADALGVISRTYQNYESTKEPRTPWGLMNDIAKVTGKTTEWLIHGDKATTPDLIGTMTGESGDAPEWATRLFQELDEKLDHVIGRLDALAAQLPGEEEQPTGRAVA